MNNLYTIEYEVVGEHGYTGEWREAGGRVDLEWARNFCKENTRFHYRVKDDPDRQPVKKPVVYVAHPVGGAPVDNCYRAVRWLKYLINADPTRIYIAPWVGEVLGFPGTEGEDDHRPWTSALGDDVQVLARCDEILLVGGKISAGMQVELDAAKKLMLRITDMSKYRTPRDLPDGFFLDPASEG